MNPCGFTKFNLYFKKIKIFSIFQAMVPEAGLEPARYRYRWILSPLRLPISPPGRLLVYYIQYYSLLQEKNELNSINSLN